MIEVRYQHKPMTAEQVTKVDLWCQKNITGHWHKLLGRGWCDHYFFSDEEDALYFGIYWKCGN